jgi:hypothetical protein
VLPKAWEDQWHDGSIGISQMYDIPSNVRIYYGVNFTLDTEYEMREVMEFRNRAKLIRGGVGSAFGVLAFEILMGLLSLGYELRPTWEDDRMAAYLEKLCSKTLKDRFQAFESELGKHYTAKEAQWTERCVFLLCGNFLAILFAITLTAALDMSSFAKKDFDFILTNQMTIWGGKMLNTMTHDGSIFTINLALNICIPGCCWGLYYEGCFRPAFLVQQRNMKRTKHVKKLFISKPSVDDYEALLEEDEVDSSGKLIRRSILYSHENFNDAVQYRDFMSSLIVRDHKNTEAPIFAMVVANLFLFTNLVLNYIIYGNFGSGYWGPWAFVACPVFTFATFRILIMAYQVKSELEKTSDALLQEIEYKLLNPTKGLRGKYADESVLFEAAKAVAERMSNQSADLTLLGLSISPTFIWSIAGYFGSLLLAAVISEPLRT